MIFQCVLLALSASIDALALGLTYGVKNTKMSTMSNIIICTIVFISSSVSVLVGHYISILFSPTFSVFLGSSLLILLGLYNIYKAIYIPNKSKNFDIDNSNNIDNKEAIALGIAIAVDASCVSLSSGVIGFGTVILPIFMATFHTLFVNCGNYITKSITQKINVSQNILAILSGILLIFLGLSKIIF